jgi:hypothetical protein
MRLRYTVTVDVDLTSIEGIPALVRDEIKIEPGIGRLREILRRHGIIASGKPCASPSTVTSALNNVAP